MSEAAPDTALRWAPRGTLTRRLVLQTVAVSSLLILLPIGAVTLNRGASALEESTLQRLAAVTDVTEYQLQKWVDRQEEAVEFLAGLEEVVEIAADARAKGPAADFSDRRDFAALAEHALGFPDLREVFLMTPVGGAVAASSDVRRIGEFRVSDLFFERGLEGTFVQRVYPSPIDGRPTVTVSTPIRRDGVVVGVLAAHLNLERIDELIGAVAELDASGTTYLVSAYNDVVNAQRFGQVEHERGTHSSGIDAALSTDAGQGDYTDHRGVRVLGAHRWVPGLELAIVSEVDRAQALAPFRGLFRDVLLMGIASLLLLVLGMSWMARRIARPIFSLSEAATRVSEGDFDVEAPVVNDDEVGALAANFNHMTSRLRSLYADLQDQARRREAAFVELAAARDRAERADRAKSEFLAMMSHEIRTPMNGVLGMTEVLLGGRLESEQRQQAEVIRNSGRALLAIIDDILDFSKIEAGRLEIEQLPFEPRTLLGEIETLLRPRAREKELTLDVAVAKEVPPALHADPGRLRQVVLNLAGNAVKFTERGGIRLSARMVPAADGQECVDARLRIEVEDTGVGIGPAALPTLFAPFQQADLSTTRKFGGTGLGLAISKRLVELMDGTIGVASEEGQGSLFWIELPTRIAPMIATTPRPTVADPDGFGAHVLVVEDNPVNRAVAEALFSRMGCTVSSVENGAEAVLALEVSSYDVVFMDCRMPVMDGYEAAREIRRMESMRGLHTPIVAMTANAMAEDRDRCMAAGMDDYITKPVELSEIVRVLSTWGGAKKPPRAQAERRVAPVS